MLDYTGLLCPVCKKPFTEDDDIVVCPVCGAPYHRACYEQSGECIFPELHEAGKDWQPPAPAAEPVPQPSAAIKDQECPFCGTLNDHGARFCTLCGRMLQPQAVPPQNSEPKTYGGYPGAGSPGQSPFAATPFVFDPMGGVNPTEPLEQGVSYGEASKVVRARTGYYMPVFRYMKQTGRNKFNFSAFLFSGAWLLYRKQYKPGIIVSIIMVLLQVAYQCTLWLWADPALEALALQAGIDVNAGMMTNQQLATLSGLAVQDTAIYLKIISPVLILLLTFIVMIIVGVRGNKMYLKHCVKEVRAIKADGSDMDAAYRSKGGVNPMAALCFSICYSIINTFLPLLFL